MTIRVLKTVTLGINPISTNLLIKKWRNKKIQVTLDQWKKHVKNILPDNFLPNDMTNYGLSFEMGIINQFDIDNTLKYIIDCLEEKYGFNDREIGHLVAHKTVIDTRLGEKHFIKISLLERLIFDEQSAEDCTRDNTLLPSEEIEELRNVLHRRRY